jgi:hypothetical protein
MLHMLVVVLPMQAPSAASVTVHVRVVDHLSLPLPGFEASAHEVSECRSRTRVSEESVKRTVASEGGDIVRPAAREVVCDSRGRYRRGLRGGGGTVRFARTSRGGLTLDFVAVPIRALRRE